MAQFDQDMPSNGFTVQALFLASGVMCAEDNFENARIMLFRAIRMAVEIGMSLRAFASKEQDPVLAECWRRTYWFMYVADCYCAEFYGAPTFR